MRRRSRPTKAWSIVLAAQLAAPVPMPGPGPVPGGRLLLDVMVNGRPIGKLGEFEARGDGLYASRRELHALGLRAEGREEDGSVPLASVPGVSVRLDAPGQRVEIEAADGALLPQLLGPGPGDALPPVESGWGAVLNYDAGVTETAGRTVVDALLDGRVFSPWGVASAQALLRAGAGLRQATRLDTTYTFSDPDGLRRFRLGDVISSGLAWTRPVRLGGVQFASDFSLRPDLVTFPVPSLAGTVAVPSTLDVLVNGVQVLSSETAPGPFELRQLPVVNGVNTVSLAVADAQGRQVRQTLSVYASAALLTPGLDAYSVELGAVRVGFGIASDDYRQAAASGSWRRGITRWLTVGAHAEATDRLAMGGASATVSLGGFGAVSAAVAGSAATGRSGALGFVAFERVTPRLSLYASIQEVSGGFRDLAGLLGDPAPSAIRRLSAGYALGQFGTVNAAYTSVRRPVAALPLLRGTGGLASFTGAAGFDPLTGPVFARPARSALVSASYTVPVLRGRATFYATLFRDLARVRSAGAVFGLTFPLGARQSASLGSGIDQGAGYATVQATRAAVAVGDWGGQLYASGGGGEAGRRGLASVQYKSPWALLEGDGSAGAGPPAWRARASGALVLADGQVFASNAVADSFAVVDAGAAGVEVLSENRPVERTGRSGRVLVPDLRSFELNRIGVAPEDLPADVILDTASRVVRPADRSGVAVRFGGETGAAASVHLVDAAGRDLPVGSRARLLPDGSPVPVGFDGLAFLRGVPAAARLEVQLPGGGSCRARFAMQPSPGTLLTVGPVACQPEAP